MLYSEAKENELNVNPKPPELYRVYIVEDHARLRQGIVGFINDLPALSVIGQAASGKAALADPIHKQADLIITDLAMPNMNGVELTRRLKQENLNVFIIILTGHKDSYFAREAFEAGASAYIVKDNPTIIERVIKRVFNGEREIVILE